jgi:peptidoglycan/xylan/chitin deacetylase (PgdA/CDA1 family)
MTSDLWASNNPGLFWLCQQEIPEDQWLLAIHRASPVLGLSIKSENVSQLLANVLGEGQFGADHWQLGLAKKAYYSVKPLLPRKLIRVLRRLQNSIVRANFPLGWPIEDRYARFLWEVLRQLLLLSGQSSLTFRWFWPDRKRYAFILTHDIETKEGQSNVMEVADLDESFGFRSSFNFVPEKYPLDYRLINELKARGFEIGVHGLRHDGKLFDSHPEFTKQATQINTYISKLDAVGFRSPLTLRNPEWIQCLEIDYDMSFFDTDPFEPIAGGTMCIWPFFIGHFVELPYTLVQDYTLTCLLGERSPRIWLEKVDFIKSYFGMALMNTHPDYLLNPIAKKVYADFLNEIKNSDGYWHALPKDIAHWWCERSDPAGNPSSANIVLGKAQLTPNGVTLSINSD